MAIASLLIVRADLAYNQTFDETAHIACGMEWLSLGTYNYETLHPPLARAATAGLLYLSGIRSEGHVDMAVEGTALLNTHDAYRHNLLLARLGVLPFFWLSSFLIYRFMRRRFSEVHAALAVMLFCFCPVVLAHNGLATTDAPFMAMFLLSVVGFARFLEGPTFPNSALAGITISLACLAKFTEIPFFLVAACVLLVRYRASGRKLLPLGKQLAMVGTVACLFLWAGYRFSTGPFFTPQTIYPKAEAKLERMTPTERALFLKVDLPAPELFRGIYGAYLAGAKQQRNAYIFGQTYKGGKWYFFPVAVLTKTPLAMLLLGIIGLIACLSAREIRAPYTAVLLGGVAGPMLIGMAGGINLGVRHVLPIYPFVAMLAAIGAMHLWDQPHLKARWRQCLVVALVGWEIVACLKAAPEFLPYFNEAAMPAFGRILVDSDLDWGQDFYRLETRLANVDPSEISLAYFGDHTILGYKSAKWHVLTPDQRPVGWVAISETLVQEHARDYYWLAAHPFERVGQSIRLYYFLRPPS